MELTTLIPLLLAMFTMFFIVMRYVSKARFWNFLAIGSIIAITTYFESIVIMVITLLIAIIWLVIDTFYTE
jgi:hypothetical protein